MTDFFKSALGIISGGGPGGTENDFVGQIVELGNQKLRVKKVIAEGINSQFLTTQYLASYSLQCTKSHIDLTV